jgi:hypothetical protein
MLPRSRGKTKKRCSSARVRWRLCSKRLNALGSSKKLRLLYETRIYVSAFRLTQPHLLRLAALT